MKVPAMVYFGTMLETYVLACVTSALGDATYEPLVAMHTIQARARLVSSGNRLARRVTRDASECS